MKLSVVITALNEGDAVRQTIASVRETTNCEIVLVDDGSTDESCKGQAVDRLIRHEQQIGVGVSRNHGATAATGDAIAFLDAHHILTPNCLNQCADVAIERAAIVTPCGRGEHDRKWTNHGCLAGIDTSDSKRHGLPSKRWRMRKPRDKLSRCTFMFVPYVVPADLYHRLYWPSAMRGWGGHEYAICAKAFFQDIDVLHLCGPLARHIYRSEFPYTVQWSGVVHNFATWCRVCFSDHTWVHHWWPNVFAKHLPRDIVSDNPNTMEEHEEFQKLKTRPDFEYWPGWCASPVPDGVEVPGWVTRSA